MNKPQLEPIELTERELRARELEQAEREQDLNYRLSWYLLIASATVAYFSAQGDGLVELIKHLMK